MTQFAVQTTQLTKTYPPKRGWRRVQKRAKRGGTQAVRGIDLAVREGELIGLLGPNGAGKTTLVKMLCTLILPSSGSAQVAGFELRHEAQIKRNVGLVVTDERSFYWRLSARTNLLFFAAMHGLYGQAARKRVDETLDAVQLLDRADTIFSDFSTGMKQRMAIARGLLHRPNILFLDEPTRSLDPISTNNLHDLINGIRAERQMTVFLITHDLGEAEKMCDRVAVMSQGQVRGVGTSAELRALVHPYIDYTLVLNTMPPELAARLSAAQFNATVEHSTVRVRLETGQRQLQTVLDHVAATQADVLSISSAEPTLEQVFSQLTQ